MFQVSLGSYLTYFCLSFLFPAEWIELLIGLNELFLTLKRITQYMSDTSIVIEGSDLGY